MGGLTASAVVDEVCALVRAERPRATDESHVAHGALIAAVDHHLDVRAPLLAAAQRRSVRQQVLARLTGLGALEPFLADDTVTEVTVNAGRDVWVDRRGRMEHVATLAIGEIDTLVERIIGPLGLRFDRTSPIVDARLADGARLCAVMAPLAVDGTCASIRRFALHDIPLSAFASPSVAALLGDLVRAKCNIVVSGATSSGKTTLLNALAGLLPPSERVLTIEDTAELRLHTDHVVRLEARRATPDGVGEITVRDLVRAALRMRPDRLVVGEVRGAEAFDMVQALNTGHDGSLSTVHANSPQDAIRRIASLTAQGAAGQPLDSIIEQVRSSIDIVVHVARLGDGRRHIVEVAQVGRPGASGALVELLATGTDVMRTPSRQRVPEPGKP